MGRTAHRYTRLAVALILGVAAGLLGGSLGPGAGALLGWSVGALVYCLWTWGRLWPLDADAAKDHAQEEDPGRGLVDALLVIAAVGSVGGVALVLVAALPAPADSTSTRPGFSGRGPWSRVTMRAAAW